MKRPILYDAKRMAERMAEQARDAIENVERQGGQDLIFALLLVLTTLASFASVWITTGGLQ